MNRKKTVRICLVLLAVCLITAGVGMYVNRSVSREATQAELAEFGSYAVDWSAAGKPETVSEKEYILSMCQTAQEEVVGANTYQTYTSGQLWQHLYRFSEDPVITQSDGCVYISYVDSLSRQVILAYNDIGLCEMGVFVPEQDIFFHQIDGQIQVWENFSTGISFGM